MMTEHRELGVIPFIEKNNTFKFIIVTSRKHPERWIFPKGQPEEKIADREVAVNEAFEEAGIIGTLHGKPVKIRIEKKNTVIIYKLYPFKISKICRKWPEEKVRKRLLVKTGKASKLLSDSPYSEALNAFIASTVS